jgi:hypothetical protein
VALDESGRSVLCRDAKTGRSIASLTVRERARRTYLQDWRARIAALTHEMNLLLFVGTLSIAPSQLMLLPDRAIAVIEPLSEA